MEMSQTSNKATEYIYEYVNMLSNVLVDEYVDGHGVGYGCIALPEQKNQELFSDIYVELSPLRLHEILEALIQAQYITTAGSISHRPQLLAIRACRDEVCTYPHSVH